VVYILFIIIVHVKYDGMMENVSYLNFIYISSQGHTKYTYTEKNASDIGNISSIILGNVQKKKVFGSTSGTNILGRYI
jgi:hypothetical protein